MNQRNPNIRFGVFEVDPVAGQLRRKGSRISLQEQPFQALLALLENPGQVVSRDELRKRLWPEDVVVDFDRGLNRAINRLREALGDNSDRPLFIETLPQRGYRFLPPVDRSPEVESSAAPPVENSTTSPPTRRGLLAIAGAAVAIPLGVAAYWFRGSRLRPIESIAVLPLENLSGAVASEYFSDGLTDELIGEISRIASLRVISRTSVMQYRGQARKSLAEIARELKVDAVLEGSVVQVGPKVRIVARLVRVQDERPVWNGRYERDLSDVLGLQYEVARAVAEQIRKNVLPEDSAGGSHTRAVNPKAFEALLKGNFFLFKGISGVLKSRDSFSESVRLNPTANAYAGLAESLCYMGIFGLRPSAETYPEARVAALQALKLDGSNAAAHNALADVRKGYDWDLKAAAREYEQSLSLNQSHLLTHLWYGECLSRMGRFDDALASSTRAVALDPVSALSLNNRAMLFFRARRYDEAIRTSQQALELDSTLVNAVWWQGLSLAGNRRFQKAIECLTAAVTVQKGSLFRALLGHVYGLAGDAVRARALLAEITEIARVEYVSPIDFAIVHAGMGEADETFVWLERACVERATRVHELRFMYFDSVSRDPRYADIARRVGLPL